MEINRNTVEMAYYSVLMGLFEKDAIAEKYVGTLSDDIFGHISRHYPEYRKAADAAIKGENPEQVAFGICLAYEHLLEHPEMLKENYKGSAELLHLAYDLLLYEKYPDFMQELSDKAYPFTLVDFEWLMNDVDKKEEKYDA